MNKSKLINEIEMYGSYERAMIDPSVNSWISLDDNDNEVITANDIVHLKEHLAEILKRELSHSLLLSELKTEIQERIDNLNNLLPAPANMGAHARWTGEYEAYQDVLSLLTTKEGKL